MPSNPFASGMPGAPFTEVSIALGFMGIVTKRGRDAVLKELGITTFKVAGAEFVSQPELDAAFDRARAAALAAKAKEASK